MKRIIRSLYLRTFIICFISMLIIMMPDIIRNNGVFLYASDYTYQQIPFYYHASDIINNFGIGWDWYTDLGSDFINSYSYYLIGSVFFWMISWLRGLGIVYAMPIMIAFKVALGAIGALAYIRRYVRNDQAAFVGAFSYAFSGFQMTVLVFNSFYDITSLFPFVLLSFDLLVKEKIRGPFAVLIGITAFTNYFFFTGIAVFLVLYYIIRCITGDFVFSIKNFLNIVFEAVIGTGTAALILVPTFLQLVSAQRVGSLLYGVDLVSYSDNTIIPKIIQSFFILPDPPPSALLFKSADNTHNWASISLYLPLFTITGVAGYLKKNSRNWLSAVLKVCFIIALVPVLNSMFYLFNSSYYARWYYMPVLLMCLATSRSLEKGYDLKFGIKIQAAALAVIIIISFLPDQVAVVDQENELLNMVGQKAETETELKWLGMNKIPVVFWQCIAFAVISLLLVYVYDHEKEKNSLLLKKVSAGMVVLTVITYIIYIDNTAAQCGIDEKNVYTTEIEYRPEIDDADDYRISHISDYDVDNISMIWGYMNAGCFHSIESNEIDNFYYNVQGKKRWMRSLYREKDYPVYGLLSVKYLFNLSTNDDLNVELDKINVEGFSLYDQQSCYYIYKNDYFVPFGFMYDYCIDDAALEKYLTDNVSEEKYQYKKLAMMRALVMSDEDIEKYSGYIEKIPDDMLDSLDSSTYLSDCQDRASRSCSSFEYSSEGFNAEISSEKPGLVYFSVPCSDGWTAKVNGRDADIIKVHYGLSAVAVEPGESHIEFFYETPGLKTGMVITFISLSVLVGYVIVIFVLKRKKA